MSAFADLPVLCRRRLPETVERDLIAGLPDGRNVHAHSDRLVAGRVELRLGQFPFRQIRMIVLTEDQCMLVQTPPLLERLATASVLTSEMPPGFTHTKIVRLAPNQKLSTLGGVRIDFASAHLTESESYALMKTQAAAALFAQTEMKIDGGSLFRVRAVAIGRFVVGATGRTSSEASNLLRLAVARFRRVEG
jgi:hypothetical protein